MARFQTLYAVRLTLAGLEAWILLIYYIYAAFTANDAAIFISGFQRFKRIRDFHRIFSYAPYSRGREHNDQIALCQRDLTAPIQEICALICP